MSSEVRIRPAATVILLRDGADGLEVWLQQRAASLAFAASMYAFPGGAVDDEDFGAAQVPAVLADQHAKVWGDSDVNIAAAHIAAAIRETHEECGVVLSASAPRPWARWVTPSGEVRRFDARFYIAACPSDQEPTPLTGEVATGRWLVLRAAVRDHSAGTLPMWPPTISNLMELVPFDSVGAALAGAPSEVEAITG